MLKIETGLSNSDISFILNKLRTAEWKEGQTQHADYKDSVKRNLELRQGDSKEVLEALQLINQRVYQAKEFNVAAFPKHIITPRFNCCKDGGFYGKHADAGIMNKGQVRTDLSSTLFLTDDYLGGELIIYTAHGQQTYKEKAGTLILYPSHYVHEVKPVTSGERICCITWVQSLIREDAKRDYMSRFMRLAQELKTREGFSDSYIEATSLYNNLFREWVE